uniref:Uncharacterized protein n=1 Tax=Oryza nivara TaxID=4536 RepID=A0A0E0GPL5_ORYNI
MAPSPLAPSTAAISTSTTIQHGGDAHIGDGWNRAWRLACGAIRRRDGWAWHSRVAMVQIVPAPRASSRSWRIDHGCVARSSVVS